MFFRKSNLVSPFSILIGLCLAGAADDTHVERQMAYDIVFTDERIYVEVDRNEVVVGEDVGMRCFVHTPTKIPPPPSFGYRVLRVGFYHRRLKRIVFDTRDGRVVRNGEAFGGTLPLLCSVDHPSFTYFTDTRRGIDVDFTPKKPGAYLIFCRWSRDHSKWGWGQLRSDPVILIVRPPRQEHAADTTDSRFISCETPELQKELEDHYDRAPEIWKKGENQWKR